MSEYQYEEKDAFLLALANSEPGLSRRLSQRLRELVGEVPDGTTPGKRTVEELRTRAKTIQQERKAREKPNGKSRSAKNWHK
ncbi:MAG: hypothetical protein AAF998_17155 [Bacteroidota bacterium]